MSDSVSTTGLRVVDLLSRKDGAVARGRTSDLSSYEQRYGELLAQIAQIGFIRSGSVARRFNYCGKPSCRCHADPPQPHGPYWQWTAKVAGKTVNRRLNPREAALYLEWIGNDRKLRALLEELRSIAEKATDLIVKDAPEV